MRQTAERDALPLPPEGGEVARRAGVGEEASEIRSRRKPGTTGRARDLRQRDNQAEALLWLELKRRKLDGHKFTRQLPIGPYFADFACRKNWLVVKVDGSQHAGSQSDRSRDEFMRSLGWSVLRFWNTDVLKHRTAVCETILAALDGKLAGDMRASDLRFMFAKSHGAAFDQHTGRTGPDHRRREGRMMQGDRPPLRPAAPTTSPPLDGGEDMRATAKRDACSLSPEGGEEMRETAKRDAVPLSPEERQEMREAAERDAVRRLPSVMSSRARCPRSQFLLAGHQTPGELIESHSPKATRHSISH